MPEATPSEVTSSSIKSDSSASAQALHLWVAALGTLIVVGGYAVTRRLLLAAGHSARAETVEWGTYLILLVAFPLSALAIDLVAEPAATRVKQLTLVVALILAAAYLTHVEVRTVLVVLSAAGFTVLIAFYRGGFHSRVEIVLLILVAAAAWMAAGALVSWTDSRGWFLGSFVRAFVLVGTIVLARFGLGSPDDSTVQKSSTDRIGNAIAMLALVVISFRTYPVLELYHWQAYVGPMEGVRQGGLLLWDVASQYGLLPILIPATLPGNGWQSFFLFQGVMNAAAAIILFMTVRRIAEGWANLALAFLVTATTLFFRPRTATLILAGQMTPSGGPVRFLWAFVMLLYVTDFVFRSRDRRPSTQWFIVWGSVIWLVSLVWSVEAAVYCSAIWFPAVAVHLAQASVGERRSLPIRQTALAIGLPVLGTVVIATAIRFWYLAAYGIDPDWTGYFEYALLYSGGFGALPIDHTGAVWYLLGILFALMTGIVVAVRTDPRDSRLTALAGAWGGAWAISSYFVSRSHPANLLSIAPFMLMTAATLLRLMTPIAAARRFVFVAMIPIFAVPAALTLSHPGFIANIRSPWLKYSRFTDQIPLMEPSLNALLLEAGAKVDDPFVRIGDGRLMLPAWTVQKPGEARQMSRFSWLPKQYELIGGLPAGRRQLYIDRMGDHLRLSGWLVDTRKPIIPHHDEQMAQIRSRYVETRRYENDDWVVSWYQYRPPPDTR